MSILWRDPPTPRPERRTIKATLFRLLVGMPIVDNNRPRGASFFRSEKAVQKRGNLNPCKSWPGWVKLAWRVFLTTGIKTAVLFVLLRSVWDRTIWWLAPSAFVAFALGVGIIVASAYKFNTKAGMDTIPKRVVWTNQKASSINKCYVGQTGNKKNYFIKWREQPHLIVSSKTGKGKTQFLLVLIVNTLLHGGHVTIIDPKLKSFKMLRKHPRVFLPKPENWPAAIQQFHNDMMGYYADDAEDHPEILDRYEKEFHLLVIDEMGSFIRAIEQTEGKNDPETLTFVERILWLGREANYQLAVGAHQGNKRVTISTDARDQFNNKVILGPQSAESKRVLFAGFPVPNFRGRIKGRGLHFDGESFTQFQTAYIDPDSVSEILSASPDSVPVPDAISHVRRPAISSIVSRDTSPTVEIPVSPAETPDNVVVGVRNAADFVGLTEAAFTQRRKRKGLQPDFREGNRVGWRKETLTDWMDSQ